MSRVFIVQDRLLEVIRTARAFAFDVYTNREGLEEDGERISVVHNILANAELDTPLV